MSNGEQIQETNFSGKQPPTPPFSNREKLQMIHNRTDQRIIKIADILHDKVKQSDDLLKEVHQFKETLPKRPN